MSFESPKSGRESSGDVELMKMVENFLRAISLSEEIKEKIKKIVRQLEVRGFSIGEIKEFLSWVKMSYEVEKFPENFFENEEIILRSFLKNNKNNENN